MESLKHDPVKFSTKEAVHNFHSSSPAKDRGMALSGSDELKIMHAACLLQRPNWINFRHLPVMSF